ncbi:MAG TPA: glycosyltransferase family 9 protein [Acidobacteriota bacterium]|nr:glycosyltransferase family 9 protein [Acidobacteriota bacterium]
MSFLQPRSVLLIVLDNLGDLVFSSVLLQQMRARWPKTDLTVWCKKYTEEIAALLPGTPRVFAADPVWHKSPGRPKGNWPDFLRVLRALRREEFDLAIITSRPWRASASAALLGIRKRIAYDGSKTRLFVTDVVQRPPVNEEHVVQELNRLLVPLFPPDPSIRYRLEQGALVSRKEHVLERRRAIRDNSAFIVLHAFAGDPKRCMAFDRWRLVAEGIRLRGYSPLLIGSREELARIRAAAPTLTEFCEFSDAYGSGSTLDDAALTSAARFFIGHDSGPLHIASALGVPVLGLYLPSTPIRTGPRGIGTISVVHKDSPDWITAEDVLAAFDHAANSLRGPHML